MKSWETLPTNILYESLLRTAFNAAGSDKARIHRYERIYQHFLPWKLDALMEVGLAVDVKDNSMKAWKLLYPAATLVGVDKHQDRMVTGVQGVTTYCVDQESPEQLWELGATLGAQKFDVIVDDASHIFANTIRTFQTLAHHLKEGGVYFIEDICKSANPEWTEQTVEDIERYFGASAKLYSSNDQLDSVIAVIKN
jgi:hypothetical protein